MGVTQLLDNIATYIINPIIVLGFVIATIYLFYGIAEMIWKADGLGLEEKRRNVKYGILGLFVMFSVYGILRLVLSTLEIQCGFIFCPSSS